MARKTGQLAEAVRCPSCGAVWRLVLGGGGQRCRCKSFLLLKRTAGGVRLIQSWKNGSWLSYSRAEDAA